MQCKLILTPRGGCERKLAQIGTWTRKPKRSRRAAFGGSGDRGSPGSGSEPDLPDLRSGVRVQKRESAHGPRTLLIPSPRHYQTLLPQTLFPNSVSRVTRIPRFERTMYFIMSIPPVALSGDLFRTAPSCFRPSLSVPRYGKPGAILPPNARKVLILSISID
jgi:hypothetical protein